MENEIHVPINSDQDIVAARQKGRSLAAALGFSSGDATLIATAISIPGAEHRDTTPKSGEIRLTVLNGSVRQGIQLVAYDKGPGIPDIPQALRDGFSTSGSLGLSIAGSKTAGGRVRDCVDGEFRHHCDG